MNLENYYCSFTSFLFGKKIVISGNNFWIFLNCSQDILFVWMVIILRAHSYKLKCLKNFIVLICKTWVFLCQTSAIKAFSHLTWRTHLFVSTIAEILLLLVEKLINFTQIWILSNISKLILVDIFIIQLF